MTSAGVLTRRHGAWGLFVSLALGCGDSGSASGAPDAAADAAPRVKERTVKVPFFPVAHRAIVEGADGSFGYGEVTPIDGARVCAKLRRNAFDSFEPFEELPEPICAESRTGEITWLALPADSDLVITVEKAGFLPLSSTARTDERDVPPQSWFSDAVSPLLTQGEIDLWLEAGTPPGNGSARVILYSAMWWVGTGSLGPGTEQFLLPPPGFPNIVPGEGVRFTVETSEGSSIAEATPPRERPSVLALRAGNYRIRYQHPTADCDPVAFHAGIVSNGLPTDAADAMELPVLDGHLAVGALDCYCAPGTATEQLVDLASCTLGAPDPGAP